MDKILKCKGRSIPLPLFVLLNSQESCSILYVFPYNSQLIITISVYTTNLIVHNISQSHKFSFHAFIFSCTFQGTYWFPNIHTYIYLFICIHKYILNSSTYIHLLLQVCFNALRFNLHLYSYINSSFNSHSISSI